MTQLAAKFTATTKPIFSAPCRLSQPAAWLPSFVASVKITNTIAETTQNGRVSFSRFGLPLRPNAQRAST